jgi:hypothetical protein
METRRWTAVAMRRIDKAELAIIDSSASILRVVESAAEQAVEADGRPQTAAHRLTAKH